VHPNAELKLRALDKIRQARLCVDKAKCPAEKEGALKNYDIAIREFLELSTTGPDSSGGKTG
jgi:hypothetical protein